MKKRTRKKRDKEKAKNTPKYEVKVDLEHYKIYDIENSTILGAEKNRFDPFIFARKNPEFAAFTFTLITSVAYFLIRMIAFLFFTGLCLYYKVDLNYINVNNDSIIFITMIYILSLFLVTALISKLYDVFAKHKVISNLILSLIIMLVFIILLNFTSPFNDYLSIFLASLFLTIFILSTIYIPLGLAWLLCFLLRNVNKKLDEQLTKMSLPKRWGIVIFMLSILILTSSACFGFIVAKDKKKFDTINDAYVVLYMNDEVAVCSPYVKKGNSITIDRSVHKNFSISDIELKTIEFDNVE